MKGAENKTDMKPVKRRTRWNGLDYDNYYLVDGNYIPCTDVVTRDVERGGYRHRTYTTWDGEILGTNSYLIPSNEEKRKSDFERKTRTANMQKGKNTYATYTPTAQYGDDIVAFWSAKRNYMQVSCGLNHEYRHCLVVDIDESVLPHDTHNDYGERVGLTLIGRLSAWLPEIGLPKPSYITIHNTNGHAQLGYVLERGVRIKTYSMGKNSIATDHTEDYERYMKTAKTFAVCLDGDYQFTHWMIKNPLNDDVNLRDHFTLYVLDGASGNYRLERGRKEVGFRRYNFEKLYEAAECVSRTRIFNSPGAFAEMVGQRGLRPEGVSEWARVSEYCNLFRPHESAVKIHRMEKKVDAVVGKEMDDRYWLAMSRNAFTRIYTYKIYRESGGTLTLDEAVSRVYDKYLKLEPQGFKGTKRHTEFTHAELRTNVTGAWRDASGNFDPRLATGERKYRSRIMSGARLRHLSKLYSLAVLLASSPDLIDCNGRNEGEIARTLSIHHRAVTPLKHELGICSYRKYSQLPSKAASVISRRVKDYASQCRYVLEKVVAYRDAMLSFRTRKIESILQYWEGKFSHISKYDFNYIVAALHRAVPLE